MLMTKEIVVIDETDSVAVAIREIAQGQKIGIDGKTLTAKDDIRVPHKIALKAIRKGEKILKYGYPIGYAKQDIAEGELVHLHNAHSLLADALSYEYHPESAPAAEPLVSKDLSFNGYHRPDGQVGIRNYIFILPLVFCANGPITRLADMANEQMPASENFDGFLPLCHPCGCGETGDNLRFTQLMLSGLADNPNAAGVLFVGNGCEINNLESFTPFLGDFDPTRIKSMVMQDVADEFEVGMKLLKELHEYAVTFKREPAPASKLIVGVNCGGSDGFSGLTANPLLGKMTDVLTAQGGSVVMTEVPEMFGAEQILMNRAKNEDVFHSIEKLINGYKGYYNKYGIEVYKNPTPGNNEGGLSTLEEKSLGCTEKGGKAVVTDVLEYGEKVKEPGFILLSAPGHDLIGITAQIAAGCNIVVFTTGRGTPGGFAAPVLRVTTNSDIYHRLLYGIRKLKN